jgi:uncharacterized coiled-coil DUF342 family protein
MKRPHRSIETFDISLMAVVTKAMGAFLVLMLLLMPYYSSSPLGKDEAQDLAKKVQDADAKIKGVLDKLGDKDLGKDLISAREELGSGAQLINQLKRYVDQLSSQVTRLEEKIATLTAELDQLKKDKTTLTARVAELEKQNAELKAENDMLKAEIEQLKKRIAELEKLVEEQKARIAELEKQIEEMNKELAELRKLEPERVEELKKLIEELKKEIASLKQEIDDLNAQIAAMQDENARLRARNAELEQQVAQLNALVVPLQQENAQQKARIAELEALLSQLRKDNAKLEAKPVLAGSGQSVDCKAFTLGAYAEVMTINDKPAPYVLDLSDGLGLNIPASIFAGRFISTFIAPGLPPNRYFLVLLSRKEEQRGDEPRAGLSRRANEEDQPNDGGGQPSGGERQPTQEEREAPLLPVQQRCTVLVSIMFSAAGSGSNRRFAAVFEPGQAVQYFGDLIIRGDWSANFTDPSPEGEAWLKDQLAHADIAPVEAAQPESGADAAPQGAPPERMQRAAPDRVRPPPRVPGERRRGAP